MSNLEAVVDSEKNMCYIHITTAEKPNDDEVHNVNKELKSKYVRAVVELMHNAVSHSKLSGTEIKVKACHNSVIFAIAYCRHSDLIGNRIEILVCK